MKVPTTSPVYRGSELPSGYTQVKYLESSGTQYINTQYSVKANTSIEVKFINSTSTSKVFGVVDNNNIGFVYNIGYVRLFSSLGELTSNSNSAILDVYKSEGLKFYRQDELIATCSGTPTDISGNLYLFASNNKGNVECGNSRIYHAKFYENNSLVRDYIPCYNSNNVWGFYDVVGGNFYTNQGSGEFNSKELTYEAAIQGAGTESDPYQIGNFYDFEYIRKISGYNNSKHYILTDDIIFNDGKFVENEETGEVEYHAGTSGELRKWSPLGTFTNCSFDGNGHDIVGFYGKGFIWTWSGTGMNNCKVKNVHYKNAYSYDYNDTNNFSKALIVDKGVNCVFENCSTDGFVNGKYGSNTMVNSAQDSTFYGCVNYAKNLSLGWQYGIGGIVGAPTNCLIENCKNYGELVDGYMGGIAGGCGGTTIIRGCYNEGKCTNGIAHSGATIYNCVNKGNTGRGIGGSGDYKNILIENCTNYGQCDTGIGIATTINNCRNYGNVSGSGIGSGTITNCINYGTVKGSQAIGIGNGTIINCENHGDVIGTQYCAAGICGAAFWTSKSPRYVYRCKNFGRVSGRGSFGIGGIVAAHSTNGTAEDYVTIVDCVNYGDVAPEGNYIAGGIIAGVTGNASIPRKVLIRNCINEGNVYGRTCTGGMIGEVGATELYIENCINRGDIKSGTASQSGCFIGRCTNNASTNQIKNCINTGNMDLNKSSNILAPSIVNITSTIASMKVNGNVVKQYYGGDFDAFFVKWKTGYVGLKSLESAGVYMFAIPDDEYLNQNGNTKMG